MTRSGAAKDRRQGAVLTSRCARCDKRMGSGELRWVPDLGVLCKKCRRMVGATGDSQPQPAPGQRGA